MSLADDVKAAFSRAAADVKAIANRVGFLERNLGYLTAKISVVRSDRDSDGFYRRITHKRANGTIFQVSQLEHDPLIDVVNGYYNKRVVTIYNKAGDTIVDSYSYQIEYDTDGVIVSETLL